MGSSPNVQCGARDKVAESPPVRGRYRPRIPTKETQMLSRKAKLYALTAMLCALPLGASAQTLPSVQPAAAGVALSPDQPAWALATQIQTSAALTIAPLAADELQVVDGDGWLTKLVRKIAKFIKK